MAVTYDSYSAKAVGFAIAMLEASPTLLSIAPSATVGNAIIESIGGLNPNATSFVAVSGVSVAVSSLTDGQGFVIVTDSTMQAEEIALHTYGYNGTIIAHLLLKGVTGDLPPEVQRRARNMAGGIITDTNALFGGNGYLLRGRMQMNGQVTVFEETGDMAGFTLAPMQILWSSP